MAEAPPGRKLSDIPENVEIASRFDFVLIGPRAHLVVEAISEAKATDSKALSEALTASRSCRGPPESDSKDPHAVIPNMNESGIFVVVDQEEDATTIAWLGFTGLEGAGYDVPSPAGWNALRSMCFVFLADTRLDVERKVLPILQHYHRKITHMHETSLNSGDGVPGEKKPSLRTVLLAHKDGARGEAHTRSTLPPELHDFDDVVGDTAKGSGVTPHCRALDLSDGGVIYDCLEQIAQQMFIFNARPDESSAKGCCSIQ